jgi:DNA-binding response OmpR family regulator
MIDAINQELGGHLVLVVDDDFRLRAYMRMVLESANFQVLEAGDGLEALEAFRVWRDKLVLVITDVRMPRMSGTEFAISLRLDHPQIPLIFVSGEPATASTNDSTNGFLFIEKPFDPKALLDAVRACLELIPL